jgi:hypothetical protein
MAAEAPAPAQTFPKGWRAPTQAELGAETLRKNSPTKYVEAKADFDGDGSEDHAALFMADDGRNEGLFVRLSSRRASGWVLVETIGHTLTGTLLMGVGTVKPGRIETACGKGYGSCAPDAPKAITLKNPAIELFRFESASSIVYWDDKAREFKRIWTSD